MSDQKDELGEAIALMREGRTLELSMRARALVCDAAESLARERKRADKAEVALDRWMDDHLLCSEECESLKCQLAEAGSMYFLQSPVGARSYR